MVSNISLEITALLFALFVLFHFMMDNKVNDRIDKLFTAFLVLGIIDISCDVASTALMEMLPGQYVVLAKLCLTVLYLAQSIMLMTFVFYIKAVCV